MGLDSIGPSIRERTRQDDADNGSPHRSPPAPRQDGPRSARKCGSDDGALIEYIDAHRRFCNTCAHDWTAARTRRFRSVDDLVTRTGLRRDELVILADIGALNSLGYDRRSALWQAERAIRPSGELFQEASTGEPDRQEPCPLRPMTETERLTEDQRRTGLTIGRHPMALRREAPRRKGICAVDLHTTRSGRRARVAGMVITRQRPGTAKGFVFLTLQMKLASRILSSVQTSLREID